VYPDPRVVRVIDEHFIPVRVHVKNSAEEYKKLSERYGVEWTPTVLTIDRTGQERHRIEGFLPTEDFLAQLTLGAAHAAFAVGDYKNAVRLFDEISSTSAGTDAGPEAQYWAGVARYKDTGDAAALKETARKFTERFQESSWAKKSSVWQ
jgi:hypothetical protein